MDLNETSRRQPQTNLELDDLATHVLFQPFATCVRICYQRVRCLCQEGWIDCPCIVHTLRIESQINMYQKLLDQTLHLRKLLKLARNYENVWGKFLHFTMQLQKFGMGDVQVDVRR